MTSALSSVVELIFQREARPAPATGYFTLEECVVRHVARIVRQTLRLRSLFVQGSGTVNAGGAACRACRSHQANRQADGYHECRAHVGIGVNACGSCLFSGVPCVWDQGVIDVSSGEDDDDDAGAGADNPIIL